MSTLNITLWSTSLSIAAIGLLFGIIASVNAAKANNKIKDIIMSTFATEEAHKLFFENVKKVIASNRKVTRLLKSSKDLTFIEYSSASAESRLIPISSHSLKIIKETEFGDIANTYTSAKENFDKTWFKIINDSSVMLSDKQMPKHITKKLFDYHGAVIATCSTMLKNYSSIISNSNDIIKNK